MKLNNSLVTDLAFLCSLLLMLVCIFFMAENYGSLQRNIIILSIVFLVVIITYFTSIAAGLIMNIVMIFAYCLYIIVSAAYKGVTVESEIYFWIFWSPAMTASTYLFTRRTLMAESENNVMKEQINYLSAVDALTGIKNMRGFEQDGLVYMKISHRYNLDLVLLVWEFRFQRELMRMIGAEGLEKLVVQISQIIGASLREEDEVFLLDDNPYMWGTLLFTNTETTDIVIARVDSQLKKVDLKNASGKHSIQLDMRVGIAQYSDQIQSPLHFLEQAKKSSEYDV